MEDRAEIIFKVLIIGDSMVGKSSLLCRFADDNFSSELQPTIGVDCRPIYINHRGRWLKLKIWDTAGQEKYRSITKSFYHGAHGAIIVYDVTQKNTFEGLPHWIEELKSIVDELPIVLVGNKCDITSEENADVNPVDESTFAEERDLRQFRVSALHGINVKEAFTALCEEMMSKLTCYELSDEKVRLNSIRHSKSSRCRC